MAWNLSFLQWLTTAATLCALTLITYKFKSKNHESSKRRGRLPPGPPGLPLVGNLFHLGESPVRTFHELRAEYGPVVWLKIGAIKTVVVQSADAAAELFKKCDANFADRKVPDSLTACDYHKGSVAVGSYGPYWRNMRRVISTEFLMNRQVDATAERRRHCVEEMIGRIREELGKSKESEGIVEIELSRILFSNSYNMIGNIMLSREVMETKFDKAGDFFETYIQFLDCFAKPNLADFFPILKHLDLQGIKKNTTKYLERLVRFASEIIEERILEKKSGKDRKTNDFLDAMLDDETNADAQGTEKLSVKNITIVLLEMFFGGIDTTSGTEEWAMAELLRNPSLMRRIQDEIDRVVGRARIVEENDLKDMPYLQACVKEVLRLYPPIPMLLPRRATKDTEFMGYVVPEDTQIFVNTWAIHRDPESWPDPLSFKPERFLDSDVDFKGQHFQMIPFGAGRRSCAGMTLGYRMVMLTLAGLLQEFDWGLGSGLKPETIDMSELVSFTLRKRVPLRLIPSPRE